MTEAEAAVAATATSGKKEGEMRMLGGWSEWGDLGVVEKRKKGGWQLDDDWT